MIKDGQLAGVELKQPYCGPLLLASSNRGMCGRGPGIRTRGLTVPNYADAVAPRRTRGRRSQRLRSASCVSSSRLAPTSYPSMPSSQTLCPGGARGRAQAGDDRDSTVLLLNALRRRAAAAEAGHPDGHRRRHLPYSTSRPLVCTSPTWGGCSSCSIGWWTRGSR